MKQYRTRLHNLLHPCIRDAKKWRENEKVKRKWRENEEMKMKWREDEEMESKWRENEEMKRKWRENEDMERKWRGNAEMERDSLPTFPHFLSTANHMHQTCQCPHVE